MTEFMKRRMRWPVKIAFLKEYRGLAAGFKNHYRQLFAGYRKQYSEWTIGRRPTVLSNMLICWSQPVI